MENMENKKNYWDKVDFEIIRNYLKNETTTKEELKILVSLYAIYIKLNKLELENKSLDKLEDEVYTIDGRIISNIDRIDLEIVRIKEKMKNTSEVVPYAYECLKNIEDIMYDDGIKDEKIEFYVKKEIVCLQALLGLNITFFKTAKELFLERNRNIKFIYNKEEKNIETNKFKNINIINDITNQIINNESEINIVKGYTKRQ